MNSFVQNPIPSLTTGSPGHPLPHAGHSLGQPAIFPSTAIGIVTPNIQQQWDMLSMHCEARLQQRVRSSQHCRASHLIPRHKYTGHSSFATAEGNPFIQVRIQCEMQNWARRLEAEIQEREVRKREKPQQIKPLAVKDIESSSTIPIAATSQPLCNSQAGGLNHFLPDELVPDFDFGTVFHPPPGPHPLLTSHPTWPLTPESEPQSAHCSPSILPLEMIPNPLPHASYTSAPWPPLNLDTSPQGLVGSNLTFNPEMLVVPTCGAQASDTAVEYKMLVDIQGFRFSMEDLAASWEAMTKAGIEEFRSHPRSTSLQLGPVAPGNDLSQATRVRTADQLTLQPQRRFRETYRDRSDRSRGHALLVRPTAPASRLRRRVRFRSRSPVRHQSHRAETFNEF